MNQSDIDTAIDSYLEIEGRFADFLRAVPYNASHLKVHSPVLASILLDACSLLESILKSAMDHARYNNVPGIAAIRHKRNASNPPYLTINDIRAVFRPDTFYAKPVWMLALGVRSFPWYSWRTMHNHPSWWRAYNKVKHNRLVNAGKAKLGTVMHTMKALFLVTVQTLDFRETLVMRGIIRSRGMTITALRPIAATWEQLATPVTIIAATSLFGYKFLSGDGVDEAEDTSCFL